MTTCLSIFYFQMWGVRGNKLRKNGGHEKDGGKRGRKRERTSVWPYRSKMQIFSFPTFVCRALARMQESCRPCAEVHPNGWHVFHFGIFCIVSHGGGGRNWACSDSLRLREVKSDGLSLVPVLLSIRISKIDSISFCSQLRWWKVTSSQMKPWDSRQRRTVVSP